jgi:hypothetical protein
LRKASDAPVSAGRAPLPGRALGSVSLPADAGRNSTTFDRHSFGRVRECLAMQTVSDGYRSLSLILELHGDKLLYIATIAAALAAGAALGSFAASIH